MKRLLSCEFNFDTVCMELKFSDGTMIAIDMPVISSISSQTLKNNSPPGSANITISL